MVIFCDKVNSFQGLPQIFFAVHIHTFNICRWRPGSVSYRWTPALTDPIRSKPIHCRRDVRFSLPFLLFLGKGKTEN